MSGAISEYVETVNCENLLNIYIYIAYDYDNVYEKCYTDATSKALYTSILMSMLNSNPFLQLDPLLKQS